MEYFGLIQECRSIPTLSISCYKYDEWFEKVDIGIWALEWWPQFAGCGDVDEESEANEASGRGAG
eukprot:scaffold238472_cov40-Cyclotella_meneghiniana.AAC.1